MVPAVFLDRDGVINEVSLSRGQPYAPRTLAEFQFLPDVGAAIRALRKAGFRIIVVTNQPDVGRGVQTREVIEAMHERLRRSLPIDAVKVCYHVDEDRCACRKPKPGMLLEAAAEWSLKLERSFMIGDRWRDIEAGKAAGCKTVLIQRHYSERQAEDPDAQVGSLLEASRYILSSKLSLGAGTC